MSVKHIQEAANDFLIETARILKVKELLPVQHTLLKKMKEIFSRQESIFMREFAKYKGKFEEAIKDKDLDNIMGAVSKDTSEDMGKAIMGAGGSAMEAAASHRIADFGVVDIAFDLKNPRAVKWLAENAALRVTEIDATTRTRMATILTQATDEGWSYNRTAKEISSRWEEFRVGKPQLHIQSRAHLVAVTEAGNAYEEGNKMVSDDLSEAGLDMEKKWQTVGDDRVSDGCRTNEGEGWIPADEAHTSGHMHPLRFPGCRCDELYRRKPTKEAAATEAERLLELPSEEYQEASWKDALSLDFEEELMSKIDEAVLSYNNKRDRLQAALREHLGFWEGKYGPYIRDLWDDSVIYEGGDDGKVWRATYEIDDKGKVKIGESKEVLVQTTYIDILEALRLGEAATVKAQVQGWLRQADAMLDKKDLSDTIRSHVKGMRTNLKKTWDELTKDELPAVEAEIGGEFMALVEGLKGDVAHIKVIQPGWGSSGFYSAEVLKRDAPVYKAGTKMYWDHPTMTEERDRPERSLRDMAGALMSDGEWMDDGPAGAGIYAKAKVFEGYQAAVAELAPHIGVSHRALGKATKGEAEGQKGNIIEQITAAQSVDFVTSPGAGGRVLQLFEAAKGSGGIPDPIKEKETTIVDEQEKKVLEDKIITLETEKVVLVTENDGLKGQVARFDEADLLRGARAFVAAELPDTLPDLTKERLTETLGKNPPVKEGKLDEEALKARITETVKEEIEYLSKVTGSGAIRGMGSGGETPTGSMKESFKDQYMRDGKNEEEAERLAEIAASGR